MNGTQFERDTIAFLIAKIELSPSFIRSKRLQKFLNFVVDFHLDNPGEKLSGIAIAADCFGRDPSNDPNDAYVRNIASQTRTALKNYYASLAVQPDIIIQLAKKGYEPQFSTPQDQWKEQGQDLQRKSHFKPIPPPIKRLLPTIAILPFQCLAGDKLHSIVGELLSGVLISNLAKSRYLHVISQRTSTQFGESLQSTRQLGAELGADYIVEGRYVVHGDSVRLQVELSSCDFDEVIWAEQFRSSVEAVVLEHDELTELMLSGISQHLLQHEVQRALNTPLHSLQCHSLLIGSLNIMHRGSKNDMNQAKEMLEQLQQRNPHHATPHAHLAYWGILNYVRDGARGRAENAREFILGNADRAIEIDAQHPVALTAKGAFSSHFAGDFGHAQEHYEKAILYSPNEASAMGRLSVTEVFTRSASQALDTAGKAIKTSPFDPELYFFHSTAATAAFGDRQYEEAITSAEQSNNLSPNNPLNLRTLIGSCTALEKHEKADKYKALLLEIEPDFNLKSFRERSLFLPKHEIIERLTSLLEQSGLPRGV